MKSFKHNRELSAITVTITSQLTPIHIRHLRLLPVICIKALNCNGKLLDLLNITEKS